MVLFPHCSHPAGLRGGRGALSPGSAAPAPHPPAGSLLLPQTTRGKRNRKAGAGPGPCCVSGTRRHLLRALPLHLCERRAAGRPEPAARQPGADDESPAPSALSSPFRPSAPHAASISVSGQKDTFRVPGLRGGRPQHGPTATRPRAPPPPRGRRCPPCPVPRPRPLLRPAARR